MRLCCLRQRFGMKSCVRKSTRRTWEESFDEETWLNIVAGGYKFSELLQNERDELAGRAKAEQSCVVDTLLVKIRKLEAEINANHVQEQLFNTLGKRMDQLEAEKRRMQARLDQASVSEDQSPASSNSEVFGCAHE
uniref:Uncharacterized protein n=1 Tax=Parascaris equorum TaxID=6256 RepID=A0A914R2R8_PAREQ